MKLKTKVILVGAAGVAVIAGTGFIIKAIKRRTKRVLDRKMRKALRDIVQMHADDFASGEGLGKSLFMHYVDKLETPQLIKLCALVQVGYFIKVSQINPLNASKDEVKRAIDKFLVEERLTPTDREGLLEALDTSDAQDALVAAFYVLGNA